jgi:hypothetical protein
MQHTSQQLHMWKWDAYILWICTDHQEGNFCDKPRKVRNLKAISVINLGKSKGPHEQTGQNSW